MHRDLKPANVMVSDDGRVKMLDFGLAKLFETELAASEGDARGNGRGRRAQSASNRVDLAVAL